MKIVFAGPSIHGASVDLGGIVLRPPAAQGDLLNAVLEGANVIGLIDGAFEAEASVWHKEILFALSEGVAVVGGASMGALRAVECADFGMEPVGVIAQRLREGELDDAVVAITHGPVELGCPPFTDALVDCEATLAEMVRRGVMTSDDEQRAAGIARTTYYKDRTVEALARLVQPDDPAAFEAAYRRCRLSIKTADALAVIARVRALRDRRRYGPRPWRLNEPPMWRQAVSAARSALLTRGR